MPNRAAPFSMSASLWGWMSQDRISPLSPMSMASAKDLPPGRGAHVQRTSLRLRRCRCGHQSGRGVLHREVSLRKGGQALQIAGGRHFEAALQPWVGVHRSRRRPAAPSPAPPAYVFSVLVWMRGGDDLVVQPQVVLRLLRPDQRRSGGATSHLGWLYRTDR